VALERHPLSAHAQDWLANFDSNRDQIERIFRDVYGHDTSLWMRRWRWFFLATSGLFGYADGSEWASAITDRAGRIVTFPGCCAARRLFGGVVRC